MGTHIRRACNLILPILVLVFLGCASWTFREEPTTLVHYRKAGHITVEKDIQNLLFRKSPEERRNELYSEALRVMIEQYGRDAVLANVYVAADWSPLSLLMGMNTVGFVEKGILRADVMVPLPEPAPPRPLQEPEPEEEPASEPEADAVVEASTEPAVETPEEVETVEVAVVEPEPEEEPEQEQEELPIQAIQTVQTNEGQISISYNVEPIVRHEDEFGYIEIEYLEPDGVRDWLDRRLEELRAEPEDYEYAYQTITDGGQVHVHIARKDQSHGNTKWYVFEILQGKKVLASQVGEEETPNRRDEYGNWWNNIPISLKNPIAEAINVRVIDKKVDRIYSFKISKTERAN